MLSDYDDYVVVTDDNSDDDDDMFEEVTLKMTLHTSWHLSSPHMVSHVFSNITNIHQIVSKNISVLSGHQC